VEFDTLVRKDARSFRSGPTEK